MYMLASFLSAHQIFYVTVLPSVRMKRIEALWPYFYAALYRVF